MSNVEPAPVRAPHPVLAVLGRALEGVLNRVLQLDPDTRSSLRALDGRTVAVEFRGTGLALRIRVDGERLDVGPAFASASDLRLAASPGSLLGMAFARLRGDGDAVLPGKVDIAGDAELARRLERLATRFEPDIDGVFTRVFGDVLGFQIARAFRRAFAFAHGSGSAFVRDGADYLIEERRDLVAKPEMEQFLDDVDDLRERADRLDARVQRLATTSRQ